MWHDPNVIQDCYLANLNEVLMDMQAFNPNVFPDFYGARRIRIISDYSGTDLQMNKTYGFLIVERSAAGDFVARVKRFKKAHRIDGKYFKYSDKSDKILLKYEPEFLNLADNTRGVLVTFTTDNPKSLFRDIEELISKFEDDIQLQFNVKISRNTLRTQAHIISLFAFIVIGFLKANQRIQWISDRDQINDTAIKRKFLKLAMEHFQLLNVTTNIDTPCFDELQQEFSENLVSVVDLMAGAASWYFRNAKEQGCWREDKGFVKGPKIKPIDRDEVLMKWIRNYDSKLKKVAFWLSTGLEDKITVLHVGPPTKSILLEISRLQGMK